MYDLLSKMHVNIMRAPRSFAFTCLGLGILSAVDLIDRFGLSTDAVNYIGCLIAFAGVIFFETNRKEEKPGKVQQEE